MQKMNNFERIHICIWIWNLSAGPINAVDRFCGGQPLSPIIRIRRPRLCFTPRSGAKKRKELASLIHIKRWLTGVVNMDSAPHIRSYPHDFEWLNINLGWFNSRYAQKNMWYLYRENARNSMFIFQIPICVDHSRRPFRQKELRLTCRQAYVWSWFLLPNTYTHIHTKGNIMQYQLFVSTCPPHWIQLLNHMFNQLYKRKDLQGIIGHDLRKDCISIYHPDTRCFLCVMLFLEKGVAP